MSISVRIVLAAVGLAALLPTFACEEFATPAELADTQILAVRVEPPAVSPGERARLDILVAGPDGPVAAPTVDWEIEPATTGAALLGAIEVDGGEVYYRAPDQVAEDPSVAAVRATVQAEERELVAVKAVGVTNLPLRNPTLSVFEADGQDLLTAEVLALAPGQEIELRIDLESGVDDENLFAWYSTAGEIERYQSNPTTLVAQEQPGDGWLMVVVRNSLGGVVWGQVPISVAAGGASARFDERGPR
ncbi:hypothetical protein [Haliangium sp.]|uniref:hypothetical protein n=1 Tax=Haliangium sp. TaxID=2663208 RepID=UPI003D0BFBB1